MKHIVLKVGVVICVLFSGLNAGISYGKTTGSPNSPSISIKSQKTFLTKIAQKKQAKLTAAIELKKSELYQSPSDKMILNQLVELYLERAKYYKKTFKKELYANDLRSALFYLRLFEENKASLELFDKVSLALIKYERGRGFDNSSEAMSALAQRLFEEKNYEASAWVYYSPLLRDYSNAKGYEAIGDIFAALDEGEKAAKYYELSIKEDGKDQTVRAKLAITYEKLGNLAKAQSTWNSFIYSLDKNEELLKFLENYFNEKTRVSPKTPDNFIALGMVYQKQGRFNEAYNLYRKSITLKADDLFINYLIGPMYYEQGKYKEAIKVFDAILEFQPVDAQIKTFKAKSLLATGSQTAAIAEYESILDMYPASMKTRIELYDIVKAQKSPSAIIKYLFPRYKNREISAEAYYAFGKQLQDYGKNEDAARFYQAVIAVNPDFAKAYVNLSQIYESKEDIMSVYYLLKGAKTSMKEDKALQNAYSSASEKYNQKIMTHADNLMQKGQFKSAIDFYKQIEPQNYNTTISIATCYQLIKDNQNAYKYYNKALTYTPNSAKIYYYMGIIAFNDGEYSRAKESLKKAMQLDKSDAKIKGLLSQVEMVEADNMINLAYDYFEKGSYKKALEILNKLIKDYPQNAQAHYYRGIIYHSTSSYISAIADFKAAASINKELEDIDYYIGFSYDKTGNKQEAIRYYDKYLNTNPQDTDYILYAQKRIIELGGITKD